MERKKQLEMERCIKVMEELIVELRIFLQLLDHEYLTSSAREKKTVVCNILQRIKSTSDCERKDSSQKPDLPCSLPAPPQIPLPEIPHPWQPPENSPPPLPTSSLPEGYYEEAVPLSPGKAPEYITSRDYDSDAMSSSYESYDEDDEDGKGKKLRHQWPSEEASMDLVKDAKICAFLLRKKRFGQWTKQLCVIKDNKLLCYKSSKDHQPQMELLLTGHSFSYVPKDGKKKKHELRITHQGADILVLAVQSKEQAEEWLKVIKDVVVLFNVTTETDGSMTIFPVNKAELEKKLSLEKPILDGEGILENGTHIAPTDGKEQGKGKKNSKAEPKGAVSKVTGKKITRIIGLGKKKPSTDEQTSSAEEEIPTCGYLNVLSNNRWRERWCRVKDNKLILHKDRTDLKTHLASFPLRGCELIPGLDSKHPLAFRLVRNGQEVAVLESSSAEEMGRWLGVLLAESGTSTAPEALHYDYIDVETTSSVIQTAKQCFNLLNRRPISPNRYGGNLANGYACPRGVSLHYDDVPCLNGTVRSRKVFSTNASPPWYEEVHNDSADLYDIPPPKLTTRNSHPLGAHNKLSTEKLSSNNNKTLVSSPLSSTRSMSSKTNTSAVEKGALKPALQTKGRKVPSTATSGTTKQKAVNSQVKKAIPGTSVKRTASNADQYKYGKNRVEADAKRLQSKEEELKKQKEMLRMRLAQLRKDKRDVRAAIEACTGKKSQVALETKLKKLEDECKVKETERVNLELELIEVNESLKKALAGGPTLGLTIEPKSSRTSSPQSPVFLHRTLDNSPASSCDTSDTEPSSLPVNAAALARRPPSGASSPGRGHVRRKAKEWEQKNGT
ncbi:actin filament-associated protein 1 isoform X4 [Callorhinchus milii]|uniref:actin filament-associated protein 1 isoform X4 n=1 Tax=Callorhinchus milii TaxID=7868 RepID=UPI001C3F94FD|nr:actin filament-associated protein 1 isoform X4 [Callorhinchus milii]